jgi:hypothetical protein
MRPAIYVLLGVLLVPTVGLVGDIVTDGQFKSTRTTGAGPPIEVVSEAMVANLNADMVDGVEGTDLYTQAEVDALVNAAGGGRIEIGVPTSFPITIDEPGSYVLTADLEVTAAGVNAIQIWADNVTLDLAGHVIRSTVPTSSKGIHSYGNSNIRVRNGIVEGFSKGVAVANYPSSTAYGGNIIENVTATGNSGEGIYAWMAVVKNCNAYDNEATGIAVRHGSVVRGSCANDNGGTGIALWASSAIDCMSYGNAGSGIVTLADGGMGSLISGRNVSVNGEYGILMVANDHNNVLNCVGYGNTAGNIVNCGNGNGCHHNYLP